jgi:ketosteroid isomerase-like protein
MFLRLKSKSRSVVPVCRLLLGSVVTVFLASLIQAQDLTLLTPKEQSDEKSIIEKLLMVQAEAWNKGNLESFMETYWKSDKLTFSAGGSITRGWQATLDRYKTRYSSPELMGKLRFDGLEIAMLESRTALVLGNWHLTLKDESKRQGNFSLLVSKIEGSWKIVHDHSSELKSP